MPFMLIFTMGNGLAGVNTSGNDSDKTPNVHHVQEIPLKKFMPFNGQGNKEDNKNREDTKRNEIPRIIRIMMELYEKKLSNGGQNHDITHKGSHKKQLKLNNLTKTQRSKIISLIVEYKEEIIHWEKIDPKIESGLEDDTKGIFDEQLMRASKLFHIDIPLANLTIDQKDMILTRVNNLKKRGVSLEEIRSEIECLLNELIINAYNNIQLPLKPMVST